jgi:hypothetical protein
MKETLSLQNLREQLSRPWLIAVFAVIYTISQITIAIIIHPIESEFVKLQTTGFSAIDYIATFTEWETSGGTAAYRAHFILDDIHWLWYSMLFSTLLAWLFQKHGISNKYNWVLLLPFASGLFDWYENHLQHVFLSSPDFSTITDPLPLFSTIASIMKWMLALCYVVLSLVLIAKLLFGGDRK